MKGTHVRSAEKKVVLVLRKFIDTEKDGRSYKRDQPVKRVVRDLKFFIQICQKHMQAKGLFKVLYGTGRKKESGPVLEKYVQLSSRDDQTPNCMSTWRSSFQHLIGCMLRWSNGLY